MFFCARAAGGESFAAQALGGVFSFFLESAQMTQHHINKSVARATGEDLIAIERRGFSLADPLQVAFDPEPSGTRGCPELSPRAEPPPVEEQPPSDERPPLVVDWDQLALRRNVAIFPQR